MIETANNTATAEEMRAEAERRIRSLRLHENVEKDFKRGVLNLSERQKMGRGIYGILFWLNEEEKRIVREFEERHHALVYHVIKNYTEFGLMYSLLYVGRKPEDWDEDRRDLEEGYALAMVTDGGMIGEIGTIGFASSGGGLVRTE